MPRRKLAPTENRCAARVGATSNIGCRGQSGPRLERQLGIIPADQRVAISASLKGIDFSEVEVERARLLRHYPPHKSRPDTERFANLHHAVDSLLVQIQVAIERLQFVQKTDQVLKTPARPVH